MFVDFVVLNEKQLECLTIGNWLSKLLPTCKIECHSGIRNKVIEEFSWPEKCSWPTVLGIKQVISAHCSIIKSLQENLYLYN